MEIKIEGKKEEVELMSQIMTDLNNGDTFENLMVTVIQKYFKTLPKDQIAKLEDYDTFCSLVLLALMKASKEIVKYEKEIFFKTTAVWSLKKEIEEFLKNIA